MSKKRKKIGLPPGSIVFTGKRKVEKVHVHYLQYDNAQLHSEVFDNQENILLRPSPDEKVDWYDVRGLHDTDLIEAMGKKFQIHPLILEDAVSTSQRPKFEVYDNSIFVICRALSFDKEKMKINTEQVAIFAKKGLLVSFQENETDLFGVIRDRLNTGKGRIRQRGSDYLGYALLDYLVDHYFLVFDEIEEVIERLEDNLLENPDGSLKQQIHHLKKELIVTRKSISPLREAISQFSKSEVEFIDERTVFFVRDLYDHTIQIMDMVETYRDILNGLQDLQISEISFRMNQVMQVLTLITTIFVPLSFLAGLYGMNFDHMPELHFRYGYFILLGVMFFLGIGLLYWFKKQRWL